MGNCNDPQYTIDSRRLAIGRLTQPSQYIIQHSLLYQGFYSDGFDEVIDYAAYTCFKNKNTPTDYFTWLKIKSRHYQKIK